MRTRLSWCSIAGLWVVAIVGCGSSANSANHDAGAESSGAGHSTAAGGTSSNAPALGDSGTQGAAGKGVAMGSGGMQALAGRSAASTAGDGNAGASGSARGAAGQTGASGKNGASGSSPASGDGVPTLFFLSNSSAQVVRAGDDGSARKVIVQGTSAGVGPDGIAVDAAAGHIYWTNMGVPSADDGTILRANLDGTQVTTIVASGGTFTPKQMKIDPQHGKLYWSDREGMRVMRANLDGSMIETLVTSGSGDTDRADASRWCVGIALDVPGGKLYWTQKGGDNAGKGTIKRANLDLPAGETSVNRSDIEVLFSGLPEPIDLDLDLEARFLYWTDRGDNTLSRAPLEPSAGFDPAARKDREILVKGLGEAIGIVLDKPHDRMFYTDLSGKVASAALDGSGAKNVLTGQGALTGITLVELPK